MAHIYHMERYFTSFVLPIIPLETLAREGNCVPVQVFSLLRHNHTPTLANKALCQFPAQGVVLCAYH